MAIENETTMRRRSKRKAAEMLNSSLHIPSRTTRSKTQKLSADIDDEKIYGADYGILPSD